MSYEPMCEDISKKEEMEVKVRNNARAIIIEHDSILLLQYHFQQLEEKKTVWVAPGGGLEVGEDFEDALVRELREELNIVNASIGECVWVKEATYKYSDGTPFLSYEKYYFVDLPKDAQITLEHMEKNEREHTLKYKWWSLKELKESKEEFFALDIYRLVKEMMIRSPKKGNCCSKDEE